MDELKGAIAGYRKGAITKSDLVLVVLARIGVNNPFAKIIEEHITQCHVIFAGDMIEKLEKEM